MKEIRIKIIENEREANFIANVEEFINSEKVIICKTNFFARDGNYCAVIEYQERENNNE